MNSTLDHVVVDGSLSITIPHEWRRSSLTIFSNGEQGRDSVAVVVRREVIDPRTTIDQYTDTVLIDLARSFPNFALVERNRRALGALPVTDLLYTLSIKSVAHSQRQICTLDAAGSILTITLSSSCERSNEHRELFDRIVNSAALISHEKQSR